MLKNAIVSILGVGFVGVSTAQAVDIYAEGQVGYFLPSDVSTQTYSGSSSGITFTNLKGDLEYENDFAFGGEIGVNLNNGFRVGVSYKDIDLSFDSATVTGSATDGTTTINANAEVTPADVDALGLTFDSGASIFLASLYYDFTNDSQTTPFVGVGVGQADVDNLQSDENVVAVSAGLSHELPDNWYVSAKGSYAQIDGGEDKLGIQYEDYTIYLVDVGLGYRF